MDFQVSLKWHWRLTLQAIWELVSLCLASIMPKRNRKSFYGVRRGRIPGVYESWDDCKRQVDGFQGNEYKSFSSRSEAEAYVKESMKCSEVSTNLKQDNTQSPKGSPIPQCESLTTCLEAEKYVKDIAEPSTTSACVDQAGSQSLLASPFPQEECFKIIKENGEQFAVFDSITDFDVYFDSLGRSSNEKDGKQSKNLKDFLRDREEQMLVRDGNEPSEDCTSVSSAKFIRAQQKAPHDMTKLIREDGEFVYVKDETELESYLATYRNIDGKADSLRHSLESQTFNGAGLWEFDGVYQLEFDGASKSNPGKSGAGALLRCPHGYVVWKGMEFLGIATSNVAEYSALILGLKVALSRGVGKVKVQTDSQLVCLQVRGVWKVKDEKMIRLCNVVNELKKCFKEFSIVHVGREFNSTADALANRAVRLEGSELVQEIIEPVPKCCQNS